MRPDNPRKLALEIINKDKWWDTLSRFIGVLRMNIFIVDSEGGMILPPEEVRFGGRLLVDRSLNFDFPQNAAALLSAFSQQGDYLESVNRYGLHMFAIPIDIDIEGVAVTIAYVIVGPVILNRRLERVDYKLRAEQSSVDLDALMDEINEIRVVSNVMMRSILDLLAEIVRDTVELTIKKKELDQLLRADRGSVSRELGEVAEEIYSTVRLDELLATLLDVALKMTGAESGSVMVLDEERGEMTIKVSRGLNQDRLQNTHVKLGEGISGIAARDRSSFLIEGKRADNRVAHLLKRPEIKSSLIMPLIVKNKVFGVLNLSTQKSTARLKENVHNLNYLSNLISSAVHF